VDWGETYDSRDLGHGQPRALHTSDSFVLIERSISIRTGRLIAPTLSREIASTGRPETMASTPWQIAPSHGRSPPVSLLVLLVQPASANRISGKQRANSSISRYHENQQNTGVSSQTAFSSVLSLPRVSYWFIYLLKIDDRRARGRLILAVPRSRTTRYRQKCLAVSGATLCNSLPSPVRDPSLTLTQFCARLKTVILQSIRNTSIAPTWQFRL